MEPILNFAQLTAHLKKLTIENELPWSVRTILTLNMPSPVLWKKGLQNF